MSWESLPTRWRVPCWRSPGTDSTTEANGGGDVSELTRVTLEPTGLTDGEEKRLVNLLARAQTGDAKALAEVRPFVERGGLWPVIGDLARRVETSWLEAMTGRNALAKEGYERRADALRRELLASGDSPLERVLVDRIIACWLQVAHADMAYAILLKSEGHSFRQGAYHQESQNRAHARFIKATKTLATVRRLLVPAVQVNIAEQQLNVLGQVSGGRPVPAADPDQQ